MKKKLFVTFATAALVAALAPAVLANSSYVTDEDIAAKVNAEIAARKADLTEQAKQDPAYVEAAAVVAEAEARLNAIVANGGGHEYSAVYEEVQEAKVAADKALYNATMRATDAYRAKQTEVYTTAAKEEGTYYGRGVIGNKNFDKTGDVNNDGQSAQQAPEAKSGAAESGASEAGAAAGDNKSSEKSAEDKAKTDKAVEKAKDEAKKADSSKKALPKTSAVK